MEVEAVCCFNQDGVDCDKVMEVMEVTQAMKL